METDYILMWRRNWLWLSIVITMIAFSIKIVHFTQRGRTVGTTTPRPVLWADLTIQGLSFGTGLRQLESMLGSADEINYDHGNTRIIYSFRQKGVRFEASANANNQVHSPFGILTGHQIEYRGQVVAAARESRKSDVIRLLGKPSEDRLVRYVYDRIERLNSGQERYSKEELETQRNDNLWVDFDDDASADPKVKVFTLFWMKLHL